MAKIIIEFDTNEEAESHLGDVQKLFMCRNPMDEPCIYVESEEKKPELDRTPCEYEKKEYPDVAPDETPRFTPYIEPEKLVNEFMSMPQRPCFEIDSSKDATFLGVPLDEIKDIEIVTNTFDDEKGA